MANDDNLSPQWEKGQSGNPKGRPPKLVTSVLNELMEEGYREARRSHILETYQVLITLDEPRLKNLANDKETPMLFRVVAKNILGKKGFDVIERMLDRVHGKAMPPTEDSAHQDTDLVIAPQLYEAQLNIINELERFNIWVCGRRFGKTVMITERVIEGAKKGFKMAIFVPSKDEFLETWTKLRDVLKPIIQAIDNQKYIIRFKKGGHLKIWSLGHKGHRKNGRGMDYDIVMYEETQSIPSTLLKYHWQNVARATLADRKGDAYFIGTPPNSKKHYFYELICLGAINNLDLHGAPDIKLPPQEVHKNYQDWMTFRDTAYSNPHIENSELDHFRTQLPDMIFRQEIMAECVEFAESPFILCCQDVKGQAKIFKTGLKVNWSMPVWLSFDFNKNPMACTLWQKGRNNEFIHCIIEFGAPKNVKVNIHYTCKLIANYIRNQTGIQLGFQDANRRVHRKCPRNLTIFVTGDATGNTSDSRQIKGRTYYEIICEELGLNPTRSLQLFRKNPPHAESFLQVNTWMSLHKDFAIDKDKCPELRNDCLNAQTTGDLKIDKATYDPHFLDTLRYFFERALPRKYSFKK